MERFLRELGRVVALREYAGRAGTLTWFDTFDWRLHQKGMVLQEVREGGSTSLLLRRHPGEAVLRRASCAMTPFARDLRRGTLRESLSPVTEPRALLPVVTLQERERAFEAADSDGKTVAVLTLSEFRAGRTAGGSLTLLPRRVVVRTVRGEGARARHLIAFLRISLSLAPPARDLFDEAVAAAGVRPGDYSSRVDVRLEPSMPGGEAARLILLRLQDIMEKNVPGAVEGTDPEFLHDLRVSVRRTRAAMSRLKSLLPKGGGEGFREEFSWLQQVTGPARDMDVYNLVFEEYRAALPRAAGRGLEPLKAFILARRAEARAQMSEALLSRRFLDLTRRWRLFLEDDRGWCGSDEGPQQPDAREIAAAAIWKLFLRALKEGRAIRGSSPPDDLHELRKTCKKLRYMIEFFRNLMPPARSDRLAKPLKALQDDLGEYQDLQVQSETLSSFAAAMMKEERLGPTAYVSIGRLIEGLHWRSLRARERFDECFRGFSRKGNRRLYRKLFRKDALRAASRASVGGEREDGQGDREEVPRQG